MWPGWPGRWPPWPGRSRRSWPWSRSPGGAPATCRVAPAAPGSATGAAGPGPPAPGRLGPPALAAGRVALRPGRGVPRHQLRRPPDPAGRHRRHRPRPHLPALPRDGDRRLGPLPRPGPPRPAAARSSAPPPPPSPPRSPPSTASPDRLVVTPSASTTLAPGHPPDPAWLAAHGLPARYLLFVGNREPRKNLATADRLPAPPAGVGLEMARRRVRGPGGPPSPSSWSAPRLGRGPRHRRPPPTRSAPRLPPARRPARGRRGRRPGRPLLVRGLRPARPGGPGLRHPGGRLRPPGPPRGPGRPGRAGRPRRPGRPGRRPGPGPRRPGRRGAGPPARAAGFTWETCAQATLSAYRLALESRR